MSKQLYLMTCSVCGAELGYATSMNASTFTTYCMDAPCRFYPITTTSRSEDPTLAVYVASLVECTDTPAVQIGKLLGRNPAWAGYITSQQLTRWSKVA